MSSKQSGFAATRQVYSVRVNRNAGAGRVLSGAPVVSSAGKSGAKVTALPSGLKPQINSCCVTRGRQPGPSDHRFDDGVHPGDEVFDLVRLRIAIPLV
jgi:hypothetical protein